MAYRDEIARLEAMHGANPEGRVFAHLAEAYRKGGELERAREVLTAGLERHPGYASAHVVLGRVLLDLSDRAAADDAFRRVLELDPHNMVALRARADIAHEQGNRNEALGYYRSLLTLDPSDEHASLRILEIESRPAAPVPATPAAPAADEPAEFGSPAVSAPQDAVPEYGEASLPAIGDDAIEPVPTLDAMERGPAESEATGVEAESAGGDVDLGLGGMLEPTDLGAEAAAEPAAHTPDAVLDLAGLEGSFAIPNDDGTDELDLPGFDEIAADATPAQTAPTAPPVQLPTAPADEPTPAPAGTPTTAPETPSTAAEPGAPKASPVPPPAPAAVVADIDSLWATQDDGAAAALPNIGPELITETIADLYAQQGLHARAAEVYRRLLEQRPGDARIAEKLAAARAAASASEAAIGTWAARTQAERTSVDAQPEARTTPPQPEAVRLPEPAEAETPERFAPVADLPEPVGAEAFDLPVFEEPETEDEPFDLPLLEPVAEEPASTVDDTTSDDLGLEPLGGGDMRASPPAAEETDALESVEAAWTGSGGAAANTASPFGWAEPEVAPEQSTIGDYLESLLAWQPPAPAAPSPPTPVATTPATPEPAPAPELGVDDIEALFGDPHPVADEIESLFGDSPKSDPFAPPAAAAPPPAADLPREAPAARAAADAFDDIDALFTDVQAEPKAATPEPAPPAASAPPAPRTSGAEGASAGAAGSAAGSAGAAGSPFEWDPFAELPVAQPPAAPANAAPAPEAAPADTPAAGADDDEDIDMFRAWLQSLKR